MWTKPRAALLICTINLSSCCFCLFISATAFEEAPHRFERRVAGAVEEASVVEKYTCKSIVARNFLDPAGVKKEEAEVKITDNTDASNKQGGRSLRKRDRNLVHQKKEHEYESNEPDEDFVCELDDGSVVAIEATDVQLREMRIALRDGTLVSQVSTLEVHLTTEVPDPEQEEQEEGLEAPRAKSKTNANSKGSQSKTAKLPPGPIRLYTNERRLTEHTQRRLGTLFRTNRMLVILVKDNDGRKPPFGANETSNKIFGTYGDKETPNVQLSGCSNNQTSLTPDSGEPNVNAIMDAPGVVEVSITISIRPFDGSKIENAAVEAANQKLGISLPGMFDFVAIVIEDCYDSNDCGFAAYAYLNSWKSVYVQDYFVYPAVVTHELGHNFNFGHSGVIRTYDDWSCSMGNPLFADHLDKMCFNPAKNWQIAHYGAWYVEHKLLLDPRTTRFASHRFVGVSEYGMIEASHPNALAVMKLETRTSTDFFMGFNRANRQNADNRFASNEVTIIRADNNGEGYSESKFIAGLKQGESYIIPEFGGSEENLRVTVNKIDTSSSPGYADVSIVFGDGGSPTPAPTPRPTHYCDGKWLKVTVDTDNYPSETSWEVVDKCDENKVVMSVSWGQYTQAGERYETEECVSNSEYDFIIYDTYADGICCSWGRGSYIVEYGAEIVAFGGEFGGFDKSTFGSCITSPATVQPTNKPTTSAPTMEPTTPPPSTKPTTRPTNFPSKPPVTPLPTSQPTTEGDDHSSGGTSKEYTTPDADKATDNAKGVMFSITAKSNDVSITALGIVGKDAKKSDIRIYSQAGSYEDNFPEKRSGKRSSPLPRLNAAVWDESFTGKVLLNPKAIVEVELDEEIAIPAGDTVSLYVVSKKGVLYKKSSSDEFESYAENDDLILKVGTTTKKEFLANFAGRIVYHTSEISP